MNPGNLVSIYKAIFAQLGTILDNKGKPLFKNIYVFNDQYKRMLDKKTTGTWLTPCIFVEMVFNNETNLGRGLNGIDITYRLHIIMTQLDSGIGTLDQNLYIFTLRDLVNKNILGFTPIGNSGPLRYVTEKQSYNHTNLYEYIISYQHHYLDETAYLNKYQFGTASEFDITIGFGSTASNRLDHFILDVSMMS